MHIALKHFIAELCIELVFDKISANFNTVPIRYKTIHDFYVGQHFNTVEVIGQYRALVHVTVIRINVIDEYITVQDDYAMSFRIDKHDIPRLRFYS